MTETGAPVMGQWSRLRARGLHRPAPGTAASLSAMSGSAMSVPAKCITAACAAAFRCYKTEVERQAAYHACMDAIGNAASAVSSDDEVTEPPLDALLAEVRACRACVAHLPLGPRPIVQAGRSARLLIVGQAPGAKVHASGVPWDDASGLRLRDWLGIDAATFYDAAQVAIMPMGYCYPGRGRGGDLPPRRECADLWHARLLAQMPDIRLTLLIGQYAQRHFLGAARKSSLTATVAAFADYAPRFIPLPHPSPRNTAWFQRHPWFERELLPVLRARVQALLSSPGGSSR